jgi:hypothetical protein
MEPHSRVLEEAIAASSSATTYQDHVKAAATALKIGDDANWELARLTYEVCGPPGYRGRDTTYTSLDTWSADVRAASGRKFSAQSARYYRTVWEKFGSNSGVTQTSWTEAYNEMRGVESMDANMVSTNFKRALAHATPEQKTDALAEIVKDPIVVDQALRRSDISVPITTTQIAHQAARQAEFDRVDAHREQRQTDNMLNSPGRTNRQFVTSAADMVEKLTTNISTLKIILDNDTVSYLRPEDVRILASKLEYLRDQAQRCLDLLPQPQPQPA